MQKLLESVASEVISFLDQRDDLVLIIHCTDNEAGMVMKIIDDVEKARQSEIFFKFADDYHMLQPYVDVLIEKLKLQHRIASEEIEKESLEPIPEVPSELSDSSKSSMHRIGSAMQYTRSLRPPDMKNNITWVMFPMLITNKEEYYEVIEKFSPQNGLSDGMQGLRIIFRGMPIERENHPFEGLPRIKSYQIDMGPEAIQKSLIESAEDESLTDDARAQSLLQYAMIASAHQRHDEAWDHLKYLLGYYQGKKNDTMQAIVINSAGDVCRRKGELEKAIGVYETAIPSAIASNMAIVLLAVTSNLASAEFENKNYQMAEKYYEQVILLSEKVLDLEGKVNALKQQSLCAEYLSAKDRIVAPLIHAWEVSKSADMDDEYQTILELLKNHESLVSKKKYVDVYKALQWVNS